MGQHQPRPSDPVRGVIALVACQLAVITELARERDEAFADQLRLFQEAEEHVAYWRTRALDAEALADALRRARTLHTCKED